MPQTDALMRRQAIEWCTSLGHTMELFKRIRSRTDLNGSRVWKASCKHCKRLCIVSTKFPKWRPDSGRHGMAPMVPCDGEPGNDDTQSNAPGLFAEGQ